MHYLMIFAAIAFAGIAHAGSKPDFAACELVLEDVSIYQNPADPTATRMDADLLARKADISARRTETRIRQLGGWSLVDDYKNVHYQIEFWLEANRPRLSAMPDKEAREEIEARIVAICL
jgi:hypothetical protein